MNEVIPCGKGFGWTPHAQEHSFNQTVKAEYVVDDELFGVDKAPPMYSKSAKTVPTASTNDVAASLQTAFSRKPPPQQHKSSDVMYNQHQDDAIKSEMNENVYGFNQHHYGNGHVQQVQQHPEMNMQMNCNMNQNPQPDQQMDIFRDLILRHLIQDISTTCAKLGLPTDPYNWTTEHGSRWITEMCQQFNLTQPPQTYLTGRDLLGMSQKEFIALSPEGGDTLYAQLQLWKTAFESYQPQHCPAGQGGPITAADNSMPRNGWMDNQCDKTSRPAFAPQPQFNPEMQNMQQFYNNGGNFTPSATAEHSSFFNNDVMLSPSNSDMSSNSSIHDGNDDECLDLQLNMLQMQRQNGMGFSGPQMMNNSMGMASPTREDRPSPFPRHSGTVHLWHFIRELLDHPKQYGSCVRWVDREEGTFKIESSHHLARFWGQRKNRSQMNYDKLSRSLRQYYKKGIIQKPEKKQRLVYKFLPPYNL